MSRTFSHGPLDFRAMSPVIRFLIFSNAIAFALAWLVGGQIYDLFGLVPVHFWHDRWVWQIVTYMFIHGGIMHLLLNLFCLWMFALPVESQWGSGEFLKYYFLCGIGSGLVTAAAHPASPLPTIGASGAIYGLLVAFAMLYPDAVVYLYFFFPIKARDMAILVGLIEFFAGASGASTGVARFTHLSGMVIGYLYIRWWWILKIKTKGMWQAAAERSVGVEIRPARAAPRRPGSNAPDIEMMENVDRILDKISAHGRESLSPEELEILRRVAERQKKEGHA